MDKFPSLWFSDIFKEITIVQKLSSKKYSYGIGLGHLFILWFI